MKLKSHVGSDDLSTSRNKVQIFKKFQKSRYFKFRRRIKYSEKKEAL